MEKAPAGVHPPDIMALAAEASRAAVMSQLLQGVIHDGAGSSGDGSQAAIVEDATLTEQTFWQPTSHPLSSSMCSCLLDDNCSASDLPAVLVTLMPVVDSLDAYHAAVAATAETEQPCIIQVPVAQDSSLHRAVLQLTGLHSTTHTWQLIAVARVQPLASSDMRSLGRCLQQAALVENAEHAMQAKAVAALTSITAPTIVVGIPQHCRQLEQLQLDQVMGVVKPATSVIAGEALEARNTAVFDRQQQHDFAGSIPYSAMEAMLMAEGCQGPPELRDATQQPADLLLTVQQQTEEGTDPTGTTVPR
jgi:hypothetical protein